MPAGLPGRRTGVFIRVHLWQGHFYLPSALCCTTDFDLQRHLQQFYPPFMRFVTRSRLRPLFYIYLRVIRSGVTPDVQGVRAYRGTFGRATGAPQPEGSASPVPAPTFPESLRCCEACEQKPLS